MSKNVQMLVPDGFEVHETHNVVDHKMVEIYPFKFAAKKRAAALDDERFIQTYRYDVEKIEDRKMYAIVFEKRYGRKPGFFERWFARWAVVPYHNVLRRKEEPDG